MREALAEAAKRRGYCAPNPAVGAVLVRDGKIIAAGHHWAAGRPHAEVEVLSNSSLDTSGTTLYVTLEPCCHWGKTPPCTKLIIERHVGRVVFGFSDPNPKVSGGGIRELREAGIDTEKLNSPEIDEFYQSYAHWTRTRRPFVTAKLAMTLDGRIAQSSGKPLAITGEAIQKFTHQQRLRTDAILTSGQTIFTDNPRFNIRLEETSEKKPVYIMDSLLKTPSHSQIFDTASSVTFFHSAEAPLASVQLLTTKGARCVAVKKEGKGLDWSSVLSQIAEDGHHDLWIEGGGTLFSSIVESNYLSRAYLYLAPRWVGASGMEAFSANSTPDFGGAHKITWSQIGIDGLCRIEWNATNGA